MPNFICVTCGAQYAESGQPPPVCAVCQDDRQYVKATGQQWTTPDKLRLTHRNSIRFEEPGLTGIGIEPSFGIGQRALLVRTASGNVLWDCVPLLDPALIEMVKSLGGLSAIAISHPHYYASMVEWSRAFSDAPILLHDADRQWVMRSDKAIVFWDGDTKPLGDGLTLVRCGGHFDGGTVLHWRDGAGGKGALLSGDIIQVVADRRYVSFMYSYPNHIPLSVVAVDQIIRAVEPFEYDRVYGAFWDKVIEQDGKAAVVRSAERYRQAIQGHAK
ncbi:MBL fold metallo-hydrolase [Zavarzinella formosa]|uniref:MBL fold metallo-hydrolase n=1 Tax=Zavarzinella formosa TaxID=360055 RepID=UPI0003036B96|nr:MBL fold metallo-hydrolase [Zavarzinella formosa]